MYGKTAFPFLSMISARFGRAIGRFLLAILLANFLSTAALSAASADMENAQIKQSQAASQSYILCSPQGLQRITLDEKGPPVNKDKAGLKYCIYCLPFHNANITVFALKIFLPGGELTPHRIYSDHHSLITSRVVLDESRPPRAPPLV